MSDEATILRILQTRRYEYTDTYNMVCRYGYLESLKYVHSMTEDAQLWSHRLTTTAASYGRLECLKYLYEHCYNLFKEVWNEEATIQAAIYGHLECLQYAHQNGCPLNNKALRGAAENGHLECVKYAIDNGCTVDQNTIVLALVNNHYKCVAYCFLYLENKEEFIDAYRIAYVGTKRGSYFEPKLDYIDLDTPTWRVLLSFDIPTTSFLYTKIKDKRIELKQLTKITLKCLQRHVPYDVIQHGICTYY